MKPPPERFPGARPGPMCATHDTELGGASPLRAARSGTASHEPAPGLNRGGPLSPLLANLLSDDLDKELEPHGSSPWAEATRPPVLPWRLSSGRPKAGPGGRRLQYLCALAGGSMCARRRRGTGHGLKPCPSEGWGSLASDHQTQPGRQPGADDRRGEFLFWPDGSCISVRHTRAADCAALMAGCAASCAA
jgi:hypothetical protein